MLKGAYPAGSELSVNAPGSVTGAKCSSKTSILASWKSAA